MFVHLTPMRTNCPMPKRCCSRRRRWWGAAGGGNGRGGSFVCGGSGRNKHTHNHKADNQPFSPWDYVNITVASGPATNSWKISEFYDMWWDLTTLCNFFPWKILLLSDLISCVPFPLTSGGETVTWWLDLGKDVCNHSSSSVQPPSILFCGFPTFHNLRTVSWHGYWIV